MRLRSKLESKDETLCLGCFELKHLYLHETEMIAPLQPPDSLHVQAAQGWLELGNPVESRAELDKVTPEQHRHPDVLKIRWEIHAAEQKWEAALKVAEVLIELEPEEALGWVHKSYSLHELRRTAEARDNLLKVVEEFPVSATILYNLACYECQLDNLDESRRWLERAFRVGNRKQMKAAALKDPDLKPLWKEIEAR
jgi:tetratricopeptide (TPR) repeat protein